MPEGDESRDRPGDEMARLTVAEAADRLGITEAGVRKRVQRGQIPHERSDDGRLFVWILPGEARHAESRDRPAESRDESRSELVEELRDRLRFVERQLGAERQAHAEARRLLAAALERIPPQIEAPREPPSEAPEARVTPSEPVPETETPPEAETGGERPWWRRVFGG
jgi:excisionase family DNA binding protein